MKRREFLFLPAALPVLAQNTPAAADVILKAMRDEMERSKQLRIVDGSPPYYIEYGLEDLDTFSVSAVLGAVVGRGRNRMRIPRLQVRVGDYSFDNTNYTLSDLFAARGGMRLPLDDDYNVIRRNFWLSTDRIYKGAVEAIARKRAALKNITVQETLNDFAKAEAVQMVLALDRQTVGEEAWVTRVKALSAVFLEYPKVLGSTVEFESSATNSYFVNSEGTQARFPDDLYTVRVRASAQAPDGMPVRDGLVLQTRTPDALPNEGELRRQTIEVAKNITALAEAPLGEDYTGPVLMEGVAPAQLIAQLIGAQLGLTRRPVSEPGRAAPLPSSELEGRMGSRILPEWMDVVDDPTQESYRGRQLLGFYKLDMEGVVPKALAVIEKGTLKSYLLTRQPVKGFEGSNGRARLPGAFGAKAPAFSNLFVKSRESMTAEELKKKFLALLEQRSKPYGLILRKLDFPSTSTQEELRRLSMASNQRGGSGRVVSPPVLAYKVFPDGREELVRGMRFRSLNVRALRDIMAVSDVETTFDFVASGQGGGGYVSSHTVVAPSLLFEDMELEKREEDWPKLPTVPPPPLTNTR